MTVGGIVGAVAGGVIGFMIGGPAGAMWGASIGFGVGMALDPLQPDIPSPGQPQIGELAVTTAKEGAPIPDVLGTTKLTGNIVWYCCDRTVEITEEQETGGKGGGDTQTVVTGYEYYATWASVLCLGPVDSLFCVYRNDEIVWAGELLRPLSGGESTIVLAGMGSMTFYFGTDDQVPNASICRKLAGGCHGGGPCSEVAGICDDKVNLNVAYRNQCWVFFNDVLIGDYNRIPNMKFVIKKRPVFDFGSYESVGMFDYNPAHALWYIAEDLVKLPKSFLHDASFALAAETLYKENLGVSILFDRQQTALTYMESVLNHVDGIIRYSTDSKLHMKLLRANEQIGDLPHVNEEVILDVPSLQRKSWIEMLNEVKVEYARRSFPCPDIAPSASLHQVGSLSEAVADALVLPTAEVECRDITLTLVKCSDKKLLEREVLSVSGTNIHIRPLESMADLVVGGTVYFNLQAENITVRTIVGLYDTIQVANAFTDLVAGDYIVIESTQDSEFFVIEGEAIFYARSTTCSLPFSLEVYSDCNPQWKALKDVPNNFAGICKMCACGVTYYRVTAKGGCAK